MHGIPADIRTVPVFLSLHFLLCKSKQRQSSHVLVSRPGFARQPRTLNGVLVFRSSEQRFVGLSLAELQSSLEMASMTETSLMSGPLQQLRKYASALEA